LARQRSAGPEASMSLLQDFVDREEELEIFLQMLSDER
jgi:hypothetical protein